MGHKRTIRPNAKKLSALFMARDKMDWDTFAKKVKSAQRGFMGEPDEMKVGRGEFHEFPYSCVCEKPFGSDDGKNNTSQLGQVSMNSTAKVQSKVLHKEKTMAVTPTSPRDDESDDPLAD